MARKKRAFIKQFLIVAGCLVAVELALSFYFFRGEQPRSFAEEMHKKIAADPRIPPERRALVQLHLALRDYRAQHGAFPAQLAQLVPAYFQKIPLDPQTAEPFKYTVEGDRYYLGDAKPAAAESATAAKTGAGKPDAKKGETQEEQSALIALLNEQAPEEDFTYTTSGKKDPFRSFDFSPQKEAVSSDNPLESYSYDELKLTAVMEGLEEPTAIVENPKGKGYMVRIGSKVGNLGGTVVKIEPDKLIIVETTVEFTGENKNREVEMFLR